MKLSPLHKRLQAGQVRKLGKNPIRTAEKVVGDVGHYEKHYGWVGPNKPDKGHRLGSCNVTACQRPGAYWYNKVMDAWYCSSCAREINYRPLGDGTYLCSLDQKAHEEYREIRREKLGLDSPAD